MQPRVRFYIKTKTIKELKFSISAPFSEVKLDFVICLISDGFREAFVPERKRFSTPTKFLRFLYANGRRFSSNASYSIDVTNA